MALPEPVRRRLSNFSRTVFSDSNRTGPEYPDGGCSPDNEIVSSLPLQMSLYFNLYFFPFWWVSSVVMLQLKVPELAGFWLLSLLLQFPLILFLLFNEGLKIQPLERAVHIIFAFFLTFQVIAAFLALKRMVNQLATRFHLHEFDQLDRHSAPDYPAWEKKRVQAPRVAGSHLEAARPTTIGWGSALKA
ncbi:transmembrane protein 17 isoform X2 [Alligator sinensis]|uniref:Transmembrane protein 17 isoform X2 n=1 Tax=Alligator sinensis TaxID=38654 RepID=A0A3Q0FKK6_ALLSI|nr:transmembrane protein 17 isoform X2 [Alligator sinensis]